MCFLWQPSQMFAHTNLVAFWSCQSCKSLGKPENEQCAGKDCNAYSRVTRFEPLDCLDRHKHSFGHELLTNLAPFAGYGNVLAQRHKRSLALWW
ncbi:hypothetical protein NYA22BAC_03462 (plasmid) [Parasphingorhabdus sp. NYA22]